MGITRSAGRFTAPIPSALCTFRDTMAATGLGYVNTAAGHGFERRSPVAGSLSNSAAVLPCALRARRRPPPPMLRPPPHPGRSAARAVVPSAEVLWAERPWVPAAVAQRVRAAVDVANKRNLANQNRPFRTLFGLIVFGIAFGYLEASVVVYLRTIGGPIRAAAGLPPQDLFPLLRPDRLTPAALTLVKTELAREAATLLMIAAVAWAVARGSASYLGAFILAFGVWDLTFYGWLRVLIGWPPSLLTWDILFLLPVPWASPVLAPCIVATTMIVFGVWLLMREPERFSALRYVPLVLGSLLILAAFTWDWRRWLAGAMPVGFPWPLFRPGRGTHCRWVSRDAIEAAASKLEGRAK